MLRRLFWLTLGAFAIGTEGLVIAGLLPTLSRDLSVSVAMAGQLVTAFSVVYAIASPVLAVATASWPRRRVLQGAMAAFALANAGAALASGYAGLMAARVALAACAGLYMATAGGYAAASVPASERGRAMSLVYLGLAVATVLGVPLGTLAGHALGWRATFAGVAALAALAFAGLCRPGIEPPPAPAATLRDRLEAARRPDVLVPLLSTVASMTGIFCVYTYLSPLVHQATGWGDRGVAGVLMLFGCGSAAGNLMGGRQADRRGPRPVILRALGGLALLFVALSLVAGGLAPRAAGVAICVVVAAWGVMGWSFPPAQQLRLVQRAPRSPAVVLSLNASATYVGIGLGAALGAMVIAHGMLAWLGVVAAGLEVLALGLSALSPRGHAAGAAVPRPVAQVE